MVKKNSFLGSLNLFNNKSAKKSYNGILIIAGILGVLFLLSVTTAAGIWRSDTGILNQSAVKLYANLSKGGNNASTIENLGYSGSFNLTIMEGTPETIAINVSAMRGANSGDDSGNISQINITFDQSFTTILLHTNLSVPVVEHNLSISPANSAPGSNVTGTNANFSIITSNGKRYSWLNTTGLLLNDSLYNATIWFNITGAVPGTYNITVLVANSSIVGTTNLSANYTKFVVKINDTTAPSEVVLNANSTGASSITPVYAYATTSTVNLSTSTVARTTIYVDIKVDDFNETGAGSILYSGQAILQNATIYVYNETGIINQSNRSNFAAGSGVGNSFAFNVSKYAGGDNLSEGKYMIVVQNITDIGGNTNFTNLRYNITIDGTQPTLAVTKASTSTQHQLVLDLVVSDAMSGINGKQCTTTGGGTDGIVMSGNAGAQTATQTGLGCNTAYTYTTSCTDHAGNTKSVEATLSTSTCTGGSSSGGTGSSGSGSDVVGSASSPYWTLTYNEATTDLNGDSDGVSVNLAEQYRVKIKVDTKLYYVGVTGTTDTTAKLNVTTTAKDKEATLNVGDVKKFDVNADNLYDISVTLNGIDSATGKADLSLVYIQEPVSAEDQEQVTEEVGEVPTTSTAKSKTWIWVVVVLVVLAIAAAILFGKKQTRRKNYGF